jgi:hypothetical protein
VVVYAGSSAAQNYSFLDLKWHSGAFVFNGASSLIQADVANSPTTGNCGASNASGISLGSDGSGAYFANIIVAELLMYDAIHTQQERDAFAIYLRLVKQ